MFRPHMNKSVMFKYVWQVVRRYFVGRLMRLCIIGLTLFGGQITPASRSPIDPENWRAIITSLGHGFS